MNQDASHIIDSNLERDPIQFSKNSDDENDIFKSIPIKIAPIEQKKEKKIKKLFLLVVFLILLLATCLYIIWVITSKDGDKNEFKKNENNEDSNKDSNIILDRNDSINYNNITNNNTINSTNNKTIINNTINVKLENYYKFSNNSIYYNGGVYPPIENNQSEIFPRVAVLSYAKKEHLYINDWVGWYLNSGFSHVFIIDNDDLSSPYVSDYIDSKYKNRVTILNERGNRIGINDTYHYVDVYHVYNKSFDWLAIFDADEFLKFNNEGNNITMYLNNFTKHIPNVNLISFSWTCILDEDICNCLEGNTSIPVYKRMFKPYRNTNFRKNIIRSGLPLDRISSHDATYNNLKPIPNQYTSKWKKINENIYTDRGGMVARIYERDYNIELLHYRTKTLGEFIKQKYMRTDNDLSRSKVNFNYYFGGNKVTQEKLDYIYNKTGIKYEPRPEDY